MAVFRVFDGQLVPENEFTAKAPEMVRRMAALRDGQCGLESIRLDDDRMCSFDVEAVAGPAVTPYTPVRFGSPLTLDIRHVWSGSVGSKNGPLGGGSGGDIAMVSGVKDWSALQARYDALVKNIIKPELRPSA